MYKTFELIFRILLPVIVLFYLLLSISFHTSAEGLYKFYFNPNTTVTKEQKITDKYTDFLASLPDEIKEHLPHDLLEGDIIGKSQEIVNINNIWRIGLY